MITLVSTRLCENETYPELRDGLSHDWGIFFDYFGLLPILIPNSMADPKKYFNLNPSGLILTGGDDIGPSSEPTQRDRTEFLLIEAAIKCGLPILGVCRGLQILNRYFGGHNTRIEDKSHVGNHEVKVDQNRIIEVNSFHDQVVTRKTLAGDLIPFAEGLDGVIEGVKHSNLPIIAVQWHLERCSTSLEFDRKIINDWMNLCA